MEFKRAVSAKYELSELVVAIRLHAAVAESTEASSALGDAAKAICSKLREQDSIYVFMAGYFGGKFARSRRLNRKTNLCAFLRRSDGCGGCSKSIHFQD